MWILLKTACGCSRWIRWWPPGVPSERIVLPMTRITKGFPLTPDDPVPPFVGPSPGTLLKRREFEYEGEYDLPEQDEKFLVYTEVLAEGD